MTVILAKAVDVFKSDKVEMQIFLSLLDLGFYDIDIKNSKASYNGIVFTFD